MAQDKGFAPMMHMGSAQAPKPLDKISVRGLVVDCRVGAFEEEKHGTQRVRFTVEVSVLPSRFANGDDVRHVLSYDYIVEAIHKVISQGHINLLETIAERVAQRCLAKRRAAKVHLLVEKLDRLEGGASLAVEIERHRGGRAKGNVYSLPMPKS